MSRALAALAARVVGRRVSIGCVRCGCTAVEGTVTRVTADGMTVAVRGVKADQVIWRGRD